MILYDTEFWLTNCIYKDMRFVSCKCGQVSSQYMSAGYEICVNFRIFDYKFDFDSILP